MKSPFLDLLNHRVVVLDGAMGANLQQRTLDLQKDWLGHENCSEILNLSRPDIIQSIHEAFLEVGCDGVETNSFNGSREDLEEAGLGDRCVEVNELAAKIARRACEKFQTPDRPRFVIGSIGPTRKLLSLGQTTWDERQKGIFEQALGLLQGGADVLLIETQQDMLAIKCAIAGINQAFAKSGRRVPLMVQASFDLNNGANMLTGTDPDAYVATFLPYDEVNILGLNCAFGPSDLAETMRHICENWPRYTSALPNAGLPIMIDGKSVFPLQPEDFTRGVMRFVNDFGVNIVGGCCGTMPEHLKLLCEACDISEKKPRMAIRGKPPKTRQVTTKPKVTSLVSAQDIRQDTSYLIIAERTNTNGSRQFKRLLQAEDWDGLVSMARDEVREGAHMLDVCVDFVGRDGISDMKQVVSRFVNSLPAPLMLDSTNPDVMEAGLKLAGGRCALNSMNLEEGEERVARMCGLAKKYGAAVVAGCIDEDKHNAMARTADRKISIARRIRDLAVNKYGLRDEDLMFDPLVLPISTGIEEDRRNALETIEGTRRITEQLPNCHTVVGLSNISFGLKPSARVVLNSAFLHELREAGLTAAIVHGSKILPQNRIDPAQWQAALDLIYDRRKEGVDPLTYFVELFPDEGQAEKKVSPMESLTIEEKLQRHIIDGEKRDLIAHLEEARQKYSPLQIVNDHLLAGMKVVGDLFGSGQMQLPFVLQSAETMKAAVAHLEQYMEKVEGSSRGRIVLATVRGDVHDIGKNLVDIILTNNGYTVYNLGIKQPIHDILAAAKEKDAHAVGMSGLLVKSVQVMKENLEEMNANGIKVPVLLGGAGLTRDYAEEDLAELYKGSLLYCKDAFEGLHMMDAISAGKLDEAVAAQRERTAKRKKLRASAVKPKSLDAADVKPIDKNIPVPTPPFWGRRVITEIDPRHVFSFVNTNALFRGQWGFKQGKQSKADFERQISDTAEPVFRDLQQRAIAEKWIDPKVIYGYWPVQSHENDLIVFDPDDRKKELLRFTFPRQEGRRKLCISDFFRSTDTGEFDVLGVQLVTIGPLATHLEEKLRAENKYQEYLYIHGVSVESAEALAEFWHKRIRQELGISSDDADSTREIFQQGYRGSRYSFGYPACPHIEDRRFIAQLLKPEEIGVNLTDNFMLMPEQSTDAIVVHHPQAKYFDV